MRHANLGVTALAILEGVWFLLSSRGLGFPDGHLTELDRFRCVEYPALLACSVLLAIVAASRRVKARYTFGAFVVLNVIALAVDGYAAHVLDHGGGG